MRNQTLWNVIALVALSQAYAEPGHAQPEGRHVGSFQCHKEPRRFAEMDFETKRKGKSFLATVTVYDSEDSRERLNALEFRGKAYSERKFGLTVDKRAAKSLPEKMTKSMSCSVVRGKVHCAASHQGCVLEVARVGSAEANAILSKLKFAQRYDEVQAMPAERRPGRTKLHGGNQRFEYVDARIAGTWDSQEVEPVDSVGSWLNQSNWKCLTTNEVSWRGGTGKAEVRHFGKKMVVVDCRGACQGLTYRWSGWNGVVTHHGLSRPAPVVEMRNFSSASFDMTWTFEYDGPAESRPRVFLHQWTSDPGDRGPGCRLFE